MCIDGEPAHNPSRDREMQRHSFDGTHCSFRKTLEFARCLSVISVHVDKFAQSFRFHETDFQSAWLKVFSVTRNQSTHR
jgi:hypothetical protein